jgi:inosine/xanthosine triphosphate pyrophosphatase family protein
MIKNSLFVLLCCALIVLQSCQEKTLPKGISFNEPEAPQAVEPVQNWNAVAEGINVSWGNSNERYHKEYIPSLKVNKQELLTGWKNERLNSQMVVWSKDSLLDLNVQIGNLKSERGIIPAEMIKHYYVRNVLSDEFLGGCGYKTKSQETAHLVPDCFENLEAYNMRNNSTRGIWFTIDIPKEAAAGTYTAELTVSATGVEAETLALNIEVQDRELPDAREWKFELDLWQNPYASARVHNVELWSEAHFEKMNAPFTMLANAGQKCITASIVHRPWGGQAYDPYDSMVKHTKKKDGTWHYDYTLFDNWVNYMMDLGIKKQINCYSLIPWGNQLWYFDEELGLDTFMVARASSDEFAAYWTPFLRDFTQHLKNKAWFDITTIAMDERPLEDMKAAISLINEHSGLKITSAANYAPGTSEHVYDLSVESRHILPDEVLAKRKEMGQKTTYYVCCSAEYPNNFTYSPPAEGVWQGWYTYAKKQDGFLRWAYNCWVEDPIHDTRFRTWPAGDTFFIYPGPKSSVRWEKLREGIQDYEKLRILMEELKDASDAEAKVKLERMHEVLKAFEVENIAEEGAEKAVLKGKELLNEFSN